MSIVAKRPTGFDDGVTDRWYIPPAVFFGSAAQLVVGTDEPAFYYALGNPQRTLRPNYDRRTEYPNLP